MARDWFSLSVNDGSLNLGKAPAESKPKRWSEVDLENLLALNPNFLEVEDHIPLRLGGVRGTVTSPDQAFVDELGRLVVVEVKKVRASLSVISQVVAYADHWRLLPPGEIDHGLIAFADERRRAEIFGRALAEVQSWAEGVPHSDHDDRHLQRLGKTVLKRLAAAWAQRPVTSMKSLAQQRWNCEGLPLIGAPARIIAMAPSFHNECEEFAQNLTQRMVGIELVEIEIVKSRGRIYVGREWVHRDPDSEPTWRLLRRAWQLPDIREHFVVNGWADGLNRESFSLSVRGAVDARFWIWASESEVSITTVVPDGWHKNDSERRGELRRKFLDALPDDIDRSKRWLEWEFRLPKQEADVSECIIHVAKAIREVLVPAALGARRG